MHDWATLQQCWQTQPVLDAQPLESFELTHRRLRKTTGRRDRREMLAAGFVALAILVIGIAEWMQGHHVAAAFAFLVVVWGVFVPFRSRRSRMREIARDLQLQPYLHRYREELLRQSRLLKNAWAWYVLPSMTCILGMTLTTQSLSKPGTWVHVVITVLLGIGVAWLNRHSARVAFDGELAQVDGALDNLRDEAAQ